MKSIIISSNCSGGGKTTVTLGLMKAFMKKGLKVQGYKVGPDYIDTAFHSHVTGNPSRNLDLYIMGEKGVKASYSRGKGDIGIVEGVMGLYDGKGIDTSYSTAHLANTLGLPVILVISPKAQSVTLCAEIMGLMKFGNVNIAGIIFNNMKEGYYKLLNAAVEKNCGIKVFGYVPRDEKLSLKSRHLGLIQSSEIKDLDEKIDLCSELILKHIDLEEMLKYFPENTLYEDDFYIENRNLKIAVSHDKAFSFYYRENLELLKEAGEVTYFSPMKDKKVPDNMDFIYLGGGYPEVFAKEVSENKSMLNSIKENLDKGKRCYAECGGLMYLTQGINIDDKKYPLVGFFNGESYMTNRLQNFGYAEITVYKENHILEKGLKIKCHEFHKSYIDSKEEKIYKIQKTMYDNSIKNWECGYLKNNTVASYGHVHFFSNMNFIKSILNK
ncbi:cobyrinic acid A,C-diamide synthase [Clostridium acetireducens DSM 10703]|uniref:Cobyrinate a,c-diamide synthase n=1 Tax=Clostridium acetireducens DSM 10703 TaxID=1121290 RepID=A0A1E8F084_9CLOT|nr:cobyrinate a,c-diamide synthase [Clostridium acetireducens]OFI06699.1 cobyrinic acid A,C-diamide synthase [Clostridium acetireducens DSM 10703]